jgi:hypothetical protein
MIGMKFKVLLLLLALSLNSFASNWTWSYRKRFSGSELDNLSGKAHVTFAKITNSKFKQLIFSWNAYRPRQGYFTFYAKTRDSKTKKWSSWYKMVEWGSAVQRSHFIGKPKGQPDYVYVRLEQPTRQYADGFRLKVEAHGQAKLSDLRSLSVSTSDLTKFKIEPVARYAKFNSVRIKGVPKQSQMVLNHNDKKKMCSPTATGMMVGYFNRKSVNTLDFAKKVYDHGLGAYGSWPFNAAHAFELCPSKTFRVVRLNSFADLYQYLKHKRPVVVSVRGRLNGAPKDYKFGHLLTVVGWDQKNKTVICHDPAIEGSRNVKRDYKLSHFLRAWESSHRLAYVAE